MMDQQSKAVDLIELSAEVDQIGKVILEMVQNNRPLLGGEHFISDSELSALLKISRRTLQQWRTDGMIPYIMLGGKVLYKESDINAMIEDNYIKSYRLE